MNPDTRLTLEQLKSICSRHAIPYKSHQRITTGFSHEVHRLNNDLILKIFNSYGAEDARRFKTESALLSSDLPFLKPKFIANSERNKEFNRDYIIMTYVPGVSLGSKWHEATDLQREKLIKDICGTLRIINQVNVTSVVPEAQAEWGDSIGKRGEVLVTNLQHKGIIDTMIAKKVQAAIARNIAALAGSELFSVYWDVHFDNFIVDANFELQAIIDLENVELTPLDYPLFVIQKMVEEPEKYLREEDEKFADKKDYVRLKEFYRKYYPEMFAFEHLDARVKIYQLLDTLHLLKDWAHVKKLHEKLNDLTVY